MRVEVTKAQCGREGFMQPQTTTAYICPWEAQTAGHSRLTRAGKDHLETPALHVRTCRRCYWGCRDKCGCQPSKGVRGVDRRKELAALAGVQPARGMIAEQGKPAACRLHHAS